MINKELEKKVYIIKEELEKEFLKKQVEILKMALTSKGNVKSLQDTVLFIDYYINTAGLSKEQFEKEMADNVFNNDFVRSTGLQYIHQQFISISNGETRIEYRLV